MLADGQALRAEQVGGGATRPHDLSGTAFAGLVRLAAALEYARYLSQDDAVFALSLGELEAAGACLPDCRMLVSRGLARIVADGPPPRVSSAQPESLGPGARLIATDSALELIEASFGRRPRYDAESRELSVEGRTVLQLRGQAHSVAAVLAALESSHWSARVADPLRGRPGGSDPQHVCDAAFRLNQHQTAINFHADGGAIRWQWRQPEAASSKRRPPARRRARRR